MVNAQHKAETGFYAAPVLQELIESEKIAKIAAQDENTFWIKTMHRNAAKHDGTRNACAPSLMRTLEEAGRRLERDGGNNYALALVTAQILNDVYLAERHGDNRYQKYFPVNKKTGEIEKITFKSEHFCQTEISDYVPVLETASSFVRTRIRTCGKAWSCPICAAKIAIRRNLEVHTILAKARAEGMTVAMLTLTAPHYSGQRLRTVAGRMQKAYAHFHNSRSMQKLRKQYNEFGRIKSMETMVGGKNGWHNHFHIVHIFDREIDAYDETLILAAMQEQWEISCVYAGILDVANEKQMAAFREHAVSLKKDFDPDYIAKQSDEWKREHGVSEKWTAAEELTFSHIKKGDGSCTAFGYVARMARLAADGYLSIDKMAQGAELFIEFCCAMHGRSMIQFSKWLRKWAGLDEKKTDKQLCDEMQDESILMIGGFDKEQHTFIRQTALWRPFKKLLELNRQLAIKTINEVFDAHGLHDFYTRNEIKSFEDSGFHDIEPPKLEAAEIGEVCPADEQLPLFAAAG